MEARHNEQAIKVSFPKDMSQRQLNMAIAAIKRHKQVRSVKRIGHTVLGILVDLDQLQGRTAQNSLGLVEAHVKREIQRANTARRLTRKQLSKVRVN